MKFLVLFAALLVGIQAVSFFDLVQEQWTSFKSFNFTIKSKNAPNLSLHVLNCLKTLQLKHRKQYESDTEEKFRLKIYMDNLHKIAVHNQKYELGMVNFRLKENKYADMLHHEFIHTLNGFNRTRRLFGENMLPDKYGYDGITFLAPANVELPAAVDWRKKGAVTPIKDQGHCGSCWSFSATGSLEGQHFRRTGKLVSLSEQNLIDCSTKYGNNGCEGGLMDYAFRYIKDNHGLDTEKTYPYEAEDDKCRYNPRNSGATDRGYSDIENGDENALKAAVATVGPISVAIDASHESFQFYSEGVYNEPKCSPEQLDHGVLVVGYGTTDDGQDYWIVKNSWGTSWGDHGYILMSRNQQNQCGIASSASYPLV